MKRALIALCVLDPCGQRVRSQKQAACSPAGHRYAEPPSSNPAAASRSAMSECPWINRRGAGERRFRRGRYRSCRLFPRALRREFYARGGLTDSSGQVTTNVSLGQQAGRYKIVASTRDASGKNIDLALDEIALGYQQTVGAQLNAQYCIRCHDPESTPQRVSNMDNLSVKPHAFTEGDTLNKMSDADLVAIISHGGPALNKSAEMPPWGYTLSKSDIAALVSYIRAVADPPYEAGGLVYAQK